jgi:hypothetical protein
MIIATNVPWLTCKDFFKQLLRPEIIACFYVFEGQRMLHETVVRVLPQKIFQFFNPVQSEKIVND